MKKHKFQSGFAPLIPIIVIALLGGGGTVVAANSAQPGDAMFGVDLALEEVRLALANESKSAELRLKFAEERLAEVEEIIAEARAESRATSTSLSIEEVEAEVFTDKTIVKVEFSNDTKEVFASDGKTEAEIIAEVAERYNVPVATVESLLEFEVEDRASRPKDKNIPARNATATTTVALGVNTAISFLNAVSADLAGNAEAQARITALIGRLETMVNAEDVKVKIKNDGEFRIKIKEENSGDKVEIKTEGNTNRIEVRERGERIRIEVKDDGEIRIKARIDSSEDDENDVDGSDDEEDEDEDEDETSSGRGRSNSRAEDLNIKANLII